MSSTPRSSVYGVDIQMVPVPFHCNIIKHVSFLNHYNQLFLTFNSFLCMCVHVCIYAEVCIWRSVDILLEMTLSYNHVGSGH